MPAAPHPTTDDPAVLACIEEVARALRAKDLDALMAHYAPDAVIFDLMPLRTLGRDAYRKSFEAWFAMVKGPIDFETGDVSIAARDDVAFVCYTSRVRSVRTTGEKTDYQVRVTAGLRKVAGRWLITHEHISMPFPGAEAMQAALVAR